MCKLLMVGAISSPRLLQRLVLIWYNPVANSDSKLRHILGTFFPLYASVNRTNQVKKSPWKKLLCCKYNLAKRSANL